MFYQTNILTLCLSTKHPMFQPEKLKPNLASLPNESCSLSCICLRYRSAKLINCLRKPGVGRVDFSIRIKRKTLPHVTLKIKVTIKFQKKFSEIALHMQLSYSGPRFMFWRVLSDGVIYIINLRVILVFIYLFFSILYCFIFGSEKRN